MQASQEEFEAVIGNAQLLQFVNKHLSSHFENNCKGHTTEDFCSNIAQPHHQQPEFTTTHGIPRPESNNFQYGHYSPPEPLSCTLCDPMPPYVNHNQTRHFPRQPAWQPSSRLPATRASLRRTVKNRLVWTSLLEKRFLFAVDRLGVDAPPMALLRLMNVTGLTRENLSSHLQKYRQKLSRRSQSPHATQEERDEQEAFQNSLIYWNFVSCGFDKIDLN
jgi:SHAQKYF class myb-like DNA-binding protein